MSQYSRLAYIALKEETTENTAIKPTVFFGAVKVDVQTKWGAVPASPIMGDRTVNVNAVPDKVSAPAGTISIEIEPKNIGYFLKAAFGAETDGVWCPIILRLSTASFTGTPQVGATLLQATSLATAVVTGVNTLSLDLRSITIGFNNSNVVTGTNPDGTTFTFTPSAALSAAFFTVGETVTGGTSTKSGVVAAISNEKNYILVTAPTGNFTNGELLTGGTSAFVATAGPMNTTVYGHEFKMPQNTMKTYTVEVGYSDTAYRFTGVKINEFKSISPKNNKIAADLGVMARGHFLNARVGAVVGASGSPVVITLDQTQGLIATDVIKVYRPRIAGFIDLNGVGIKTHTISSLVAETSITIPSLTTALEAGDLVILAPQTPSYTVGHEFPYIGATVARIGDTITAAVGSVPSAASIETFDIHAVNEVEERFAANAQNVAGRFPSLLALKGWKGDGKFGRAYVDETWLDRLRNSTATALHVKTQGDLIGATGIRNSVEWYLSNIIFKPYMPVLDTDALVSEEVPFDCYKAADGYNLKAVLVNDVSAY